MSVLAPHHGSRPRSPLIVIVDADRRVRRSLTDLLALGGLRVAGSAADSGQAIALLERQLPDLLIIDPQLPTDAAGAYLLARIRQAWPDVKLLLMGWRERGGDAQTDGTAGYVSKGAQPAEFLRAIMEALPGSK